MTTVQKSVYNRCLCDSALVFIEDDDDSSGLSIIGACTCTCTCVPVLSDSALVFIEDDDDSSGLSIIGIYLYVAFSWLLTSVVSKDQPHFMYIGVSV